MDKHFHVLKKTQKNSKRVNLRVSSLMIPFARMINSTTGSCESMGFPRQFPHDSNNDIFFAFVNQHVSAMPTGFF